MLHKYTTSDFASHHVVSKMQPWLLFAALLPVIVIVNYFSSNYFSKKYIFRSFATAPMEQQQPYR
jgi:hypothetical protein